MKKRDDERAKLLGQLKGRMARLSRQRLAGTTARVGDAVSWPQSPGGSSVDRITIRETEDGLGIHNPSRRLIPVILFLLLWLGGWSVGEYFALHEIFTSGNIFSNLFLIFWVTFWTLGGLAAWTFVLWQLFGVEQLFVTAGAVVHEIGLWRLRRRRVYPIDTVSDFQLSGNAAAPNSTNSAISFQAGGKARRFGVSLSKEEAEASLAAILRHLPKRPEPEAAEEPDEDTAPQE